MSRALRVIWLNGNAPRRIMYNVSALAIRQNAFGAQEMRREALNLFHHGCARCIGADMGRKTFKAVVLQRHKLALGHRCFKAENDVERRIAVADFKSRCIGFCRGEGAMYGINLGARYQIGFGDQKHVGRLNLLCVIIGQMRVMRMHLVSGRVNQSGHTIKA